MMNIDINETVNQLLLEGFVILDDCVSSLHLDLLHHKMLAETLQMIHEKKWGGVGSLQGHLQQNPPRYAPYVFRDIVSNPLVIDISERILGENFYSDFYSANTNCPGSMMQPVHSDCGSLWQGNRIAHPPVSLIINIPLVDVDENNGSMEIWPGSHRILHFKKYVEADFLEARQTIAPPIRANMKKGSILIRDARLWHRGMPNISNHPRHMLAMIHHIHWLQRNEKLAFAKGCELEILDKRLQHHIYFTDGFIDHSIDPTNGEYSQIPES